MPTRILRMKAVCERSGLTRTSVYRAVERGELARPVRLGPRCVGWHEPEVEQWLSTRERC